MTHEPHDEMGSPDDPGLSVGEDAGPALPGFEDVSASSATGYQVLARKYRPQSFADLIGQEPMVRTLTNAFAAGRIAHAYMLTGVRGIGKTTTARLIARALNYETDTQSAPSMDLDPPGRHCDTIAKSSHVDVMEMDAASRTGINDIREILDGVRYAPVSARFKVYIIDEVHMLSTAAFNALLKTLEEPPEHVKFVFATTEIRKVPVTVLSRCQRFDLKRVERGMLADHLERICAKENASVEREGLEIIARAAEGSVRDALSLLDQAIVQAEAETAVNAEQVRDMLGLADRSRILDLLEATLQGRAKDALGEVRAQYDAGADPQVVMRDVLDYLHGMSRVKAAGHDADLGEARETVERLTSLAEQFSLAALARLWKAALTGLDDVRVAPDPVSAAEMAVLRLMAAASLPSPEDAARLLAGGALPSSNAQPDTSSPSGDGSGSHAMSTPEAGGSTETPGAPASPTSLEDLVALIDEQRDIGLKIDVERFVRPVSFKPGAVKFQSAEGAPAKLGSQIATFLQEVTGQRWLVDSHASGGGETLSEARKREETARREELMRDPALVKAMMVFPGADLISVEDADTPQDTRSADDADAPQSRQEQTQ